MLFRSLLATLLLACLALSPAHGRDRDRKSRDRDDEVESPPEVVNARSQAQSAYQQGDFAKAIELSDWLIARFPKDHIYVPHYLRGSAKVELGQRQRSAKLLREGIADARQAILLEGQRYPRLHVPYVYGLSSLATLERRPEHAEMAIKVVTPLLSLPQTEDYPADDRANLYYQRGVAYAAKRDLKAAAADYAEAIKISPDHLGAYIKRAETLATLGQPAPALAAYDEAVSRFPNSLLAFNERGSFRKSNGDLDGAISDFTRSLQIDPRMAVGYVNRGSCLVDRNEPLAAEADFSEALKFAADSGTKTLALRLRGSARLAQGNAKGALADFSEALRANPEDGTIYEERALAHFFARNFTIAAADFAHAAKLNPQATHLVFWQALSVARAGQSGEARTLLTTAMAGKSPPTGWTAKIVGFLLDEASEEELLAAAGSDSRLKNRQLSEARYFAGQKQLLHENAAAAEQHFREAIALNDYLSPSFRGSRYELGEFK